MNFNSVEFFIFLPIVFLAYWQVFSKSKASQNLFLLLAGIVFYAWWHIYFLLLLAFSVLLNYYAGLVIGRTQSILAKRRWLRAAMAVNIVVLAGFKYFNFFIPHSLGMLNSLGIHWDMSSLTIILPIGISFYTFYGLGYLLDIYHERIEPEKNLLDYSLYISFFPLLVAGPIEKAGHLLPQFKRKRAFSYAQGVSGLRLILWGMFKKVVIADSLAPVVNYSFDNYEYLNGFALITGAIGFSFQIYSDFSGYSDIARGTAKLLGIDVMKNFNYPFWSRNIAEYWSRWHTSLSVWLTDYLYMPLAIGLRDYGRNGIYAAVFITFVLAGLWHGAGWAFLVFGALHGLYYLPLVYSRKGIKTVMVKSSVSVSAGDIWKIVLTYVLVCFALVFFRADSVGVALQYLRNICVSFIKHPRQLLHIPKGSSIFLYVVPFLACDYLLMSGKISKLLSNRFVRILAYIILIASILYCLDFFDEHEHDPVDFIYYQF